MRPVRLLAAAGSLLIGAASLMTAAAAASAAPAPGARPAAPATTRLNTHMALDCEYSAACAEVANSKDVFGPNYVGHDEPSALFYSNKPGSGNRNRYDIVLPRDPSPGNPQAKSYQFELASTFFLGMAMCDTQSYPEQVSTCTPDSDRNIVDPAVSPEHPGTAFMEMQFYPPGWVPWPTWAVAVGASGCDPTRWCAAINIDSLSENPVDGTTQNPVCAAKTGLEYVNFAFITKDGRSQAPANPVDSTLATFTPNKARDLFMHSGDHLRVTSHDTAHGLKIVIDDLTSGQSGSMTASATNGFAQVKFDPKGTSCQAIPYDFHPMYSTSSPQTRVIWAAHTYNIAVSQEIGHFQSCTGPVPIAATPFGVDSNNKPIACPAGDMEGIGANKSPADGDDNFCFPASEAQRIRVSGCTDTNSGFDGISYQKEWPNGGGTALHPLPLQFTSPLTGSRFDANYSQAAFEADLPRIEGTCDRTTGVGCTLIPAQDNGQPAVFYPFYSAFQNLPGACLWAYGDHLPGANDFGRNAQYGSLLSSTYLKFGGGGATVNFINDFRQILTANPCRA